MKQSITFELTLAYDQVLVPPPAFTLPNAVPGLPYSFQCPQPTQGVPPYTWTPIEVPAWMTVSPSGFLSGMPGGIAGDVVPVKLKVSDAGQ